MDVEWAKGWRGACAWVQSMHGFGLHLHVTLCPCVHQPNMRAQGLIKRFEPQGGLEGLFGFKLPFGGK